MSILIAILKYIGPLLFFLLFGLVMGPYAIFYNFSHYEDHAISSIVLELIAIIIFICGIKFRSKKIGKILMAVGIFLSAFTGLMEIGRWC